ITIDNDHFTQIKNSHNLTVEGESRTLVKQDTTSIVEGSFHQKVGQICAIEVGSEVHLNAGLKIVIEAGAELTLKAGGSFIKVDASSVSLVGAKVNLNSGGSPGSGSGYGGLKAALPMGLDLQQAPESLLAAPTTSTMSSLLTTLATLDISAAELCQKRTDGSCAKTNCECTNHEVD
ncbi:type VI secretion system tip protein VgrG, partial [Vibrio sinaloensis]|nr:type VI secretion system tip protein VgrG [Vibrio sinaloensis]